MSSSTRSHADLLTLSETYLDGALLFVGGLSIVRAE
jgi:hypothetical protein